MAETLISFDVCLHLCAALLNANSSKTVKATNFKFDTHVSRDRSDMTLKIFLKRGHSQGHVTPKFKLLFCKNSLGGDIHSYERLLVIIIITNPEFLVNERE